MSSVLATRRANCTRGGALIHYTFPVDGEYSIRVQLARRVANTEDIPSFDQAQRLEVSVDGEPVQVFTLAADEPPKDGQPYKFVEGRRRSLDANWKVRFPAKAGPREIGVTFLNRTPALLENFVQPFLRPYPG